MKFRKIPVVIDAVRITEEHFTGDHPNPLHVEGVTYNPESKTATVQTLEGIMHVQIGDWIITGVEGEKYPCKDSIFKKTYYKVLAEGEGTLVQKCARCGEDHKVQFRKLRRMMEVSGHTHWAPCPNTSEPILMKVIPEELKDHKHKLTLEKPDGERSGCSFKVDPEFCDKDPDMYMIMLGAGLAALYRHEYEKTFGTSPPATIFRNQFSWGGIQAPTNDPELVQKFVAVEKAEREARIAFLKKYGPENMENIQSQHAKEE